MYTRRHKCLRIIACTDNINCHHGDLPKSPPCMCEQGLTSLCIVPCRCDFQTGRQVAISHHEIPVAASSWSTMYGRTTAKIQDCLTIYHAADPLDERTLRASSGRLPRRCRTAAENNCGGNPHASTETRGVTPPVASPWNCCLQTGDENHLAGRHTR